MGSYLQLLKLLSCVFLLIHLSSQAPQLQKVLDGAKLNSEAKIYDYSDLPGGYWTELRIGTPPQTFKVLLDFSWSRLFLPSVQCTTSLCRPDAAYRPSLFNETASETFVPSNKRNSVAYVGTSFKGTLGDNVANLARITVEQQEFLDATEVSAPGFLSFYRSYDGVLGLAPFNPSDESDLATYPSLFKSMVRDKLITPNIFTLELPQGRRFVGGGRTPGSLRFGQSRISPNAENVIRLPLSGRSIAEQTWYSPGTDLDWDQGRPQLQIVPNYPVQIDPGSLAIRLPKPLASRINQQISLPNSDHHIDCNERSNLPSLVLTFEGGSRLELTPIDYTLERRFSNGTLMGCMSLFYDTDRIPGIVIGAGVLENYNTEWDLDGKEIRLERRTQQ